MAMFFNRRAALSEFGRQWFSKALTVTEEHEYVAAMFPVSAGGADYGPVDDDMEYILDYLEAEQWEEQHAMPLSVEVDREMEEVAEYIEASSWSPRRAMPADVEVETEMEEVLDCIDAEQWMAGAPRQDAMAQQQAKGWANPFRGEMRPLATARAPALAKTERRKK